MIANVSPHRRANAFAQALEDRTESDLSDPEPAAEQSEAPAEPADHARLLALASALGELPRPQMDADVKVVQRAQLVAAMEAMVMEERAGGGNGPWPPVVRRAQRMPGCASVMPLRAIFNASGLGATSNAVARSIFSSWTSTRRLSVKSC